MPPEIPPSTNNTTAIPVAPNQAARRVPVRRTPEQTLALRELEQEKARAVVDGKKTEARNKIEKLLGVAAMRRGNEVIKLLEVVLTPAEKERLTSALAVLANTDAEVERQRKLARIALGKN